MDSQFVVTTNPDAAAWLTLVYANLWISVVIGLAAYIYCALVLMAIAKKTNTANGWLAWIPIANIYLMTQLAKVPWWTFLVIFLAWIPIIGYILLLAVMIWWWWKICQNVNRPGWWSLLITFVPIVNIIMLGMLAWTDAKK